MELKDFVFSKRKKEYDICCEVQYGRKPRVLLKGVMCSVLVSTMIISMAGEALAFDPYQDAATSALCQEAIEMVETYSIPFQEAYSAIVNRLKLIKEGLGSNKITVESLQELKKELYVLDIVLDKSDLTTCNKALELLQETKQVLNKIQGVDLENGENPDVSDIVYIVDEMEKSIKDLDFMRDIREDSSDVGLTTLSQKSVNIKNNVSSLNNDEKKEVNLIATTRTYINSSLNKNDENVTLYSVQNATENAELKFYYDMESHWANSTVMKATELGLFNGTKAPDENGGGYFDPNKPMTRAEFITVCVRAIGYPATDYYAGHWYDGYWDQAVSLGLISSSAFGGLEGLNEPMTREEMAYTAANTLKAKGETIKSLGSSDIIPDFYAVTYQYQDEVLVSYAMGIIVGMDDNNTFNPSYTLTRAQAATVAVRLVDESERKPVTAKEKKSSEGVQTWREGELHGKPKAGDTIIASDGQQYTLTEVTLGKYTILGLGVPADIWTGWNNFTVGDTAAGEYNPSDTSILAKSSITGEVHSQNEWSAIANSGNYPKPSESGAYPGEVQNTYWFWRVKEVKDAEGNPAVYATWVSSMGDITE